jgi:hypothetical protein
MSGETDTPNQNVLAPTGSGSTALTFLVRHHFLLPWSNCINKRISELLGCCGTYPRVTASQVALAAIITCKQKSTFIYKYFRIFPLTDSAYISQLYASFISGIPDMPVTCNF